jgi:NADH:ubiquinone oxidoreductase subunit 5 (subunit L)/multisubunit Na+/H+ antiporter MnhA subunit
VAAVWIGIALTLAPSHSDANERPAARIALGAAALSLLAALTLSGAALVAGTPGQVDLGSWLTSGKVSVALSLGLDPLGLAMATLTAFICLLTLRFSVHYMHREPGFRRFFMVLSLFTGAMLLIVTAGNAVLAFAGWELAGVSSYLLIGYANDRTTATLNATRAFVTNRIGDAGFLLAIFLSLAWLGSTEWPALAAGAEGLRGLPAGLLLLGFLLAALAKSGMVPFSGWIGRALEGPTPSSAVFYGSLMVHAGVFLLIRVAPLFEQAPALRPLVAVLGIATAIYGWLTGLTKADVKGALMASTTTQVGLMLLWCALGWFELATAHLMLHALWRAYQFLHAPALMHWMPGPTRPLVGWLAHRRRLYNAAVNGFWLDPASDALVVRPTQALARDLQAFDDQVVNRLVGLPSQAGALASMTDWEARRQDPAQGRGRGEGSTNKALSAGRGLLGGFMEWLAGVLHWFEERLVLRGGGEGLQRLIHLLGGYLLQVDELLAHPRYLLLLIMATLVVIL